MINTVPTAKCLACGKVMDQFDIVVLSQSGSILYPEPGEIRCHECGMGSIKVSNDTIMVQGCEISGLRAMTLLDSKVSAHTSAASGKKKKFGARRLRRLRNKGKP